MAGRGTVDSISTISRLRVVYYMVCRGVYSAARVDIVSIIIINTTLYMPLIIIIAILLGGGASLAAQQSLPGDALYSVKVSVNEKVIALVKVSEEAKANWDARLAVRRLEEAEELAAKSELDADVRANLEANFKSFADRVEARIIAFEDRDQDNAVEVIANFETALKTHQRILLAIGKAKSDQKKDVDALAAEVKVEEQDSAKIRKDKEAEVSASADVEASANGRRTAAENKINEVEKYISSKADVLGASATVQAEARLQAARDLIVRGDAQLSAQKWGAAFVLFGQAHATAQEAKLLIEAKANLDTKPTGPSRSPSVSESPKPTVSPRPSVSTYPTRKPSPLPPGRTRVEGEIEIDLGL